VQEVQERRLLRQLSRELEKRHRLIRERGEDRVGRRLLSRYRFAHTLFQQYLYNGLSAGERRILHGEVASILAELLEGREEEIAVQLAFHYCRAGMEEEALPHLIQAGHQARARFANDEALSYYTQALDLIPRDSPERFDLLACRAAVYGLVAHRDAQKADVDEMLGLAEKLGDKARLCDALLALAGYHLDTRFLDAQEPAQRALEIAQRSGDPLREARALHRLSELDWYKYEFHRSQEELEAAIDLFLEADSPGEAASCLHMLSLALGSLNELGPATEAAKRSIALSREIGDRRQEAIASRRLAIAYQTQRRNAEALPFAQRALVLHREVGDRHEECNALNVLGILQAHLGEYEEAERSLRQSLRTAESIESSIGIAFAVTNLMVYHYVRQGGFESFLHFLDTLLDKAKAIEDDWLRTSLRFYQGLALVSLGQYDRAVRTMAAAAERMEQIGDLRSARLLAWGGLAQAYLGDYEGSTETFQTATERAQESRDDETIAVVLVLWALANLQEGHRQALRAGLERALAGLPVIADTETTWKSASYESAAALYLALGETDLALKYSTQGLEFLALDPSLWWTEHTHFTHSRILRALGQEAEADEYLKRAYNRVMLVAARTADPELKQSWLEAVEVNQEILAACARRGIGQR
jgi:tetratricopeptide (TPR) repeat protein